MVISWLTLVLAFLLTGIGYMLLGDTIFEIDISTTYYHQLGAE